MRHYYESHQMSIKNCKIGDSIFDRVRETRLQWPTRSLINRRWRRSTLHRVIGIAEGKSISLEEGRARRDFSLISHNAK